MSTNYIDQITDTASTPVTHDIQEATDIRIFRATCGTGASTAAKVATLQDNKNFSLTTGVRVAVTFTYGNSAGSPTLRVDGSSTGTAKYIAFPDASNSKSSGNGATYNTWGPSETVIFTYDGNYWVNSGSALGIYNAYALANSKGSGTITEVKTTAGTHSTIDVTSGKAEFNVPTKTSHLTNDSNFVTSSGVTSIATSSPISGGTITTTGTISHATSGVGNTINTAGFYKFKYDTYGHVTGVSSVTASDITGLVTIPTDEKVKQTPLNGTNSVKGLLIGVSTGNTETTSTAYTTDKITWNDSTRQLHIYDSGKTKYSYLNYYSLNLADYDSNYTGHIQTGTLTAARNWYFPDKAGTVALTSDIPTLIDEKVSTAAITAGTTYYPILGTDTTAATTKYYDANAFSYKTNDSEKTATLIIGNNLATSNSNYRKASIELYSNTKSGMIQMENLTHNQTYVLPDTSGMFAMKSDVPKIQIVRW